ncbi:hypothetical protein QAD02_015159 [Eretmocerus hayati]|uniref:Uncharacterized protein n=1 Tax=Eretmocerus hayati TaxID=131215 RepID=A0ACC2P7W3_9HYME|nr:hypothetical protein QAD02_015159 [Eretmocerus hayati]
MKFLVVFAVVLISASVKAQDEAGTYPNTDGLTNVDPGSLQSPVNAPEVPTESQPPVTEAAPILAPSIIPASNDSFGERVWKTLEKIMNGSETVPMALIRAELARLNRNLYSSFDYKLVLLSDCPELKAVELPRKTLQDLLFGAPAEKAIGDGVLRARNRILTKFGIMLVAKDHVCQNPTSS